MCCRLNYLHSQKIVHRDVKTENMLLDKTRTVKIADFGVARIEASNPNDMTGETGTLGYMAPEVKSLPLFNLSHDSLKTQSVESFLTSVRMFIIKGMHHWLKA